MSKNKKIENITITRATVVKGVGRVEIGRVMTVGADITLTDARLLIGIKKAKEGAHEIEETKELEKDKK